MALSNEIVCVPSAVSTCIAFGPENLASPRMIVTLRCFANAFRPPVNLLTMLFFQSSTLRISTSGSAKVTPCAPMSAASLIICAVCNNAFEGIQPTLSQTPPMRS